MKKMINKLKKKIGFTLVELIVVIAIIGVLAAILIPMLSDYIQKAYAANDRAVAKSIYDRAMITMTEDFDAFQSFYSYNSGDFVVGNDGYCRDEHWNLSVGSDEYKLVVVAKINGARGASWARPQEFDIWEGCNNEQKYFARRLSVSFDLIRITNKWKNENKTNWGYKDTYWLTDIEYTDTGNLYKGTGQYLLPMKYTSHTSHMNINGITGREHGDDGGRTDRWLIGCKKENWKKTNLIEVWAGYSGGNGGSGPRFRIYPDPCGDY